MKVCMLAYTFYENDNRVRRYAEALAERGDTVEIISLRRENQSTEEVINGVRVFRIQERVVNERGKFSYFFRLLLFFFNSSFFLLKKSLAYPYDVVHIHTLPDFEVFAAWFPKILGAKVILDFHEIAPEFYANKFNVDDRSIIIKALKLIEKASAHFADQVIFVNHLLEEKLISRSTNKEKCATFINYPGLAFFTAFTGRPTDGRFVIIYPGTLHRHQGVDVAVKAFRLIKDKLPGAEFHIYGEGSAQPGLENLIRELGLSSRVFLKKPLPSSEIVRVIAMADIGIVPKRADSYGNMAFSTKILEFMALGVPVIVSDTRIDKYYFDDSMVRFFKSGDDEDLAEAILDLAKNTENRDQLVENARRYAAANSWEVKKHDYIALVDKLKAGQA